MKRARFISLVPVLVASACVEPFPPESAEDVASSEEALGSPVLDPSFGANRTGFYFENRDDTDGLPESGAGVAALPNGKSIVVGRSTDFVGNPRWNRPNVFVRRLLENGQIDRTFGTDGFAEPVITRDGAVVGVAPTCVALGADGAIFIGGAAVDRGVSNRFIVIKLTPNGALDRTFSGDGSIITNWSNAGGETVRKIFVNAAGKVLAIGGGRFSEESGGKNGIFFARFLPDGSYDTSFKGDGTTSTYFPGMHVVFGDASWQPGEIAVVGTGSIENTEQVVLLRYREDGSLDTRLNGSGAHNFAFSESRTTGVISDGDRWYVAASGPSGDDRSPDVMKIFTIDIASPTAMRTQIIDFPDIENDAVLGIARAGFLDRFLIYGAAWTGDGPTARIVQTVSLIYPWGTPDRTFNGTGHAMIDNIVNDPTPPSWSDEDFNLAIWETPVDVSIAADGDDYRALVQVNLEGYSSIATYIVEAIRIRAGTAARPCSPPEGQSALCRPGRSCELGRGVCEHRCVAVASPDNNPNHAASICAAAPPPPPPPPPPPTCSGVCCERLPNGGCNLCAPSADRCP